MDENELYYGDYLLALHSAADSFSQRLTVLERIYAEEKRRFPAHSERRINRYVLCRGANPEDCDGLLAILEHELKYKKHVSDARLMSDELKRCADKIISVDLKMQTIYKWLNQCHDAENPSDGHPRKKSRSLKVD